MRKPVLQALPAPSIPLRELEEEAVRLARGAGAILLEHFRQPLKIEYKSANQRDPVTEADRRAEAYLREAISRQFPDHGIVGEEAANSAHATPDFAWVLDPLDGTTNFLNGLPVFASSIGIVYHGQPVVAAVFLPGIDGSGGSVYHARVGGGARQDGQPIAVASNTRPERGQLSGMPAYYWRLWGFKDGLRQRLGELRSTGSIVYEMAMTARGTFQFCMFNAPRVWDVAGGILLVNEAGGRVLARPSRSRRWEPFSAFVGAPVTLDRLRDWRAGVLAGNAELTTHVSDRIRQRSFRWRRLQRWASQKLGRPAGGQEQRRRP